MSAAPPQLVLDRAALVADGAGVDAAPGVVLRRGIEVIAAGTPESIGTPAGAEVVEHPRHAIIPALGNAHAHLDLSELEPAPFDGDFAGWLARVRDFRRGASEVRAVASLDRGAELLVAGGVALVGDIVGAPLSGAMARAVEVIERHGLRGVAFVELFGAGAGRDAALAAITAHALTAAPPSVQLGLQPHAPYSTCNAVVDAALGTRRPFSIHLAEDGAEVEYALHGSGPIRAMLDCFSARSEHGARASGAIRGGAPPVDAGAHGAPSLGAHPVVWFCERVALSARGSAAAHLQAPTLAVHLNETAPQHWAQLAALGIVAVYCPRATAYFGRRALPWRELIAAGMRVALGTDGRLCLDTPSRISTLDEMRLLAVRDGATLRELLPLATINVARGLGFDECMLTLAPGVKPGLLLLACGSDPRRDVLARRDPPAWLARSGHGA